MEILLRSSLWWFGPISAGNNIRLESILEFIWKILPILKIPNWVRIFKNVYCLPNSTESFCCCQPLKFDIQQEQKRPCKKMHSINRFVTGNWAKRNLKLRKALCCNLFIDNNKTENHTYHHINVSCKKNTPQGYIKSRDKDNVKIRETTTQCFILQIQKSQNFTSLLFELYVGCPVYREHQNHHSVAYKLFS